MNSIDQSYARWVQMSNNAEQRDYNSPSSILTYDSIPLRKFLCKLDPDQKTLLSISFLSYEGLLVKCDNKIC